MRAKRWDLLADRENQIAILKALVEQKDRRLAIMAGHDQQGLDHLKDATRLAEDNDRLRDALDDLIWAIDHMPCLLPPGRLGEWWNLTLTPALDYARQVRTVDSPNEAALRQFMNNTEPLS